MYVTTSFSEKRSEIKPQTSNTVHGIPAGELGTSAGCTWIIDDVVYELEASSTADAGVVCISRGVIRFKRQRTDCHMQRQQLCR